MGNIQLNIGLLKMSELFIFVTVFKILQYLPLNLKKILIKYLSFNGCLYRMFIWRKILELPENFSAYAALIDKGAHPSYSRLHELYPIKSRKLLRILQR